MKISPIVKKRVYKIIIEQIKESIRRGELKPGDKMPSERDLAEQLEVSRTAVREAFSVLDSIGLIEIFPGIGIYLRKTSNEVLLRKIDNILKKKNISFLEIIEVRQGIEVQAAHLASIRRTKEDLTLLKQAYDILENAVSGNLIGAKEDFDFHMAIIKASRNNMLIQIFEIFHDEFLDGVERFRIADLKIPTEQRISLDVEHLNIYQAIVEKDSKKAQEMVWQHMENIKMTYLTKINPNGELFDY